MIDFWHFAHCNPISISIKFYIQTQAIKTQVCDIEYITWP